MARVRITALAAAGAFAVAAGGASAQSGTTAVQGTSSVYLSNGNTMTAYSGGGQGTSPNQINLTTGTGRTATFTATGTWGCAGAGSDGFPPDGSNCAGSGTNLYSSGKISGIVLNGRTMPLVGVFTDGTLPSSAPSSLTFGSGGIDYTSSSFGSPALGQIFFIGDGLTGTGSGANQLFSVPDNATTLFLGVADGYGFTGNPGYYDDNVGSVNVSYSIGQMTMTPEPSSLALLGTGLFGLVPMLKRRLK